MESKMGRPKITKRFGNGVPQFIVTRALHITNANVDDLISEGYLVISHKTAKQKNFTIESVLNTANYLNQQEA